MFKRNILKKIITDIPNNILIEKTFHCLPYCYCRKLSVIDKPLYHYIQRSDSILKTSFNQREELQSSNII